jgi:hypothetical protein
MDDEPIPPDFLPDALDEKRGYPRYVLRVPLRMRGLNSRGETVDTDIEVVDISVAGIGFHSARPFEDGDILYVSLQGKDYTSDVSIQIVWTDARHDRYGARIIAVSSVAAPNAPPPRRGGPESKPCRPGRR